VTRPSRAAAVFVEAARVVFELPLHTDTRKLLTTWPKDLDVRDGGPGCL
jgi:hypothetical protein